MKKVLHFAFPTKNLEVEWRFIFCERFSLLESTWPTPWGSSGSFAQMLEHWNISKLPDISVMGRQFMQTQTWVNPGRPPWSFFHCNVVISPFQQIDLENTFTAGRKFKCWDFRTPGLGINWALPTLWTRQEIENRTVESPPDCYVDFMAVRPIYNQWKYKGNPKTQPNIIGM